MRDYARIGTDGRVLEVVTTGEAPSATGDHTWVDLYRRRKRPGPGWSFDGERFAPPPPPMRVRTTLSSAEFQDRLDADELDAAAALATTSPAVLVLLLALLRPEVDLTNERIVAGVEALAAAGVLSATRASEVLRAA